MALRPVPPVIISFARKSRNPPKNIGYLSKKFGKPVVAANDRK